MRSPRRITDGDLRGGWGGNTLSATVHEPEVETTLGKYRETKRRGRTKFTLRYKATNSSEITKAGKNADLGQRKKTCARKGSGRKEDSDSQRRRRKDKAINHKGRGP